MSTKERILSAALELFNTEGVGGQSAVDIASALSISAGHLYYHFKGKPEILAELMGRHREEIDLVVESLRDAVAADDAGLESLWTHVHILVEETWDARFFWREPALALSHPVLAEHARHILVAIRAVISEAFAALQDRNLITVGPEVREGLAYQIAAGVVFHVHALELEDPTESPRERIARAAAQIMIPASGLAAA